MNVVNLFPEEKVFLVQFFETNSMVPIFSQKSAKNANLAQNMQKYNNITDCHKILDRDTLGQDKLSFNLQFDIKKWQFQNFYCLNKFALPQGTYIYNSSSEKLCCLISSLTLWWRNCFTVTTSQSDMAGP